MSGPGTEEIVLDDGFGTRKHVFVPHGIPWYFTREMVPQPLHLGQLDDGPTTMVETWDTRWVCFGSDGLGRRVFMPEYLRES